MKRKLLFLVAFTITSICASGQGNDTIYFRVNLMGYQPADSKTAIVFSDAPMKEKVNIIDATSREVIKASEAKPTKEKGWGTFKYFYTVDFSGIGKEGRYYLESEKTKNRSVSFDISATVYNHQADRLRITEHQIHFLQSAER